MSLGRCIKMKCLPPCSQKRASPRWLAFRLALVTLMQCAEGLADRQAAHAVRARLDWKYALGLELEDQGFDFSVLCEFRARLIEGKMEYELFEALLTCLKQRGLIRAGGCQRTDATHVLAAVRAVNRVVCVGETMRAALGTLADVAPEWLRSFAPDEWYERYAHRVEEYRLRHPRKRSALPWLKPSEPMAMPYSMRFTRPQTSTGYPICQRSRSCDASGCSNLN